MYNCTVCGAYVKDNIKHIESKHKDFCAVSNELKEVFITSKSIQELQLRTNKIFEDNGVMYNLVFSLRDSSNVISTSKERNFENQFGITLDRDLVVDNKLPYHIFSVSGVPIVTDNTKVLGKMLELYINKNKNYYFTNVIGYAQSKNMYWSDTFSSLFYSFRHTHTDNTFKTHYISNVPSYLLPNLTKTNNLEKIDERLQEEFDNKIRRLVNAYNNEVDKSFKNNKDVVELNKHINWIETELNNLKKHKFLVEKQIKTQIMLDEKIKIPEANGTFFDLTNYNEACKLLNEDKINNLTNNFYLTEDIVNNMQNVIDKAKRIINKHVEIFL